MTSLALGPRAGTPLGRINPVAQLAAIAVVTHDADLVQVLADDRISLARTTGERASQRAPASEERNEPGVEPWAL